MKKSKKVIEKVSGDKRGFASAGSGDAAVGNWGRRPYI
jgi:hypothetical protein